MMWRRCRVLVVRLAMASVLVAVFTVAVLCCWLGVGGTVGIGGKRNSRDTFHPVGIGINTRCEVNVTPVVGVALVPVESVFRAISSIMQCCKPWRIGSIHWLLPVWGVDE